MRNVETYKRFLMLKEQEIEDKKDTTAGMMDAYENDAQARSNISGKIQANANYSSLFNAIKNYWTKQIPLLKNKPKTELTSDESNALDTIESKFKTGDTREVENFAMKKIISGHSKELEYDKDKKSLRIKGYTETPYDKEIKSK